MRKRIKVFFMMFLISFSFFVVGCKNENDSIVDNGLNVKSTDGTLFPPPFVVHYKTEKRFLSIGEDLNVSISFGRILDYKDRTSLELKSATAELLMIRDKWDYQFLHYERIDSQILKVIDDFSLDEYKETFTSENNIVNITIPSQWFDNSWDCVTFYLKTLEVFSTKDIEDVYELGTGACLYYRIIGEQIKLYGRFYEFKNDNV